jgi:hypothetical protein
MCDNNEMAELEQGIGNNCPFTGEPCWDDMECSECDVEKAYMSYMESKRKEEE